MKIILILIVVLLLAIQFIPVDRTNPPVKAEIDAPANVKAIFKKACYDCHSNETVWPWYSYIAPVSWLIADDVEEGRDHLNFSGWENLSRQDKAKEKDEIWEHIEKDEMPLGKYKFMHPEAKLSQKEKDIIKDWAGG